MDNELNEIIKHSFELINNREYKSAIEMLYPKLTDYPECIEIITQIAQCYFLMGEIEQAEEYYEKAFEINNYNTIVLDPLIEIKIKLEKYNEVETYAQYYLKCEDKIYATQKYLETINTIRNYNEIEEFIKNTDKENLNSISLCTIACALIENSDKKETEDEKNKLLETAKDYALWALEKDKNNIQALCELARYYYLTQNYEEIGKIFNENPQLKNSDRFVNILGITKCEQKDFPAAIEAFSKAIELNENDSMYYHNLSEAYIQQGWLKEAEIIAKKGLAIDENSINLRLSLAYIYYLRNEIDKTLLTLAFVSEREPDNVQMNLLYMYSYAHQDNFIKAEEYAQKLNGKYDSSFINSSLAAIHSQLGHIEKAHEKIDEALSVEPNNINYLTQKADLLFDDGKIEETIKIYDKIIEINPNYVDAYYQKSILCIYLKQAEEAIKYAKKAVEMDCNNTEYQYNLAKLYNYTGDFDKAIDCAKFSLSITPDDINKYWFIGYLYLEKGDAESAIEYYKEILAINPNDFDTLSKIAKSLAAYNYPQKAYEYYQKAYRVNPYDYDFIRDYSDFSMENISAFKGIKILLNFSKNVNNKNLSIESKNRARRIIRENRKRLSFLENLKFLFV